MNKRKEAPKIESNLRLKKELTSNDAKILFGDQSVASKQEKEQTVLGKRLRKNSELKNGESGLKKMAQDGVLKTPGRANLENLVKKVVNNQPNKVARTTRPTNDPPSSASKQPPKPMGRPNLT